LALAVASAATTVAMPWSYSEDFTWKYEFDPGDPTPNNADIDSNSEPDFYLSTSSGATSTVAGGFLNMDSAQAGSHYYASGAQDGVNSDDIWEQIGPTLTSGYTIEFRARVNSQLGTVAAFTMNASALDANFGWLMVGIDSLKWGPSGTTTPGILDSQDNSDWHVYRLVQREDFDTYDVWRDGVSVTGPSGIGYGYPNLAYTRLLFGDFVTSSAGGDYDIDYIRFTTGAYAPAPEPASCVLLLCGGLGLATMSPRRRRRTRPTSGPR